MTQDIPERDRARAELIDRISRWLAAFGEPTGLGRASPDNDMIYLLRDCKEALKNG